ncbi:GNAT family N-acetyltransferase [Nocardioides sp.]|uniref:GNAT family N-acetyltransferase n=1 Tax=Nocardioides sp. TaxID=35761 RepID=UPI00271AFABC|nr:GNAT family N-acetyltransferase [Nocardioides sp.]MDO9454702.1 GNAT family N-acetyltransferase [Nocardioides sp.]
MTRVEVEVEVKVEVRVDEDTFLTTVRPGESWWAAARRTTPGVDDPVAVDLSGGVKRFAVDPSLKVALRPLTYGDLPDVVTWRAADHVRRWWDDDVPDLDAAIAKYAPRIEGTSATTMWVWEVNGRSVGLAQDYRIRDYPDHALLVPDPDAIGVDYLIGRPEWVGRGIGTRCLWAWATQLRDRHPDATGAFAAPDHRNRASLRALAKAGYVEGLWFDEPQADGSVDTVVGCTLDLRTVVG